MKRALNLLRDPRGSTVKSIVKLINEDEPGLSLKTILQQLNEEVQRGRLSLRDGRFKPRHRERDAFQDYDIEEADEEYDDDDDDEDDDEEDEDEEEEEEELEEMDGEQVEYRTKREADGTEHPKGEKEKDKEKDEKSNKEMDTKKVNDNDNTEGQAYDGEKCYPCTKKRKRSCPKKRKKKACPKKKRKTCPKKKKRSCPKKKRKPSCPKKKKPSCPKRCPKPENKCPPDEEEDEDDDDECDGEAKPVSPVVSFNSFSLVSKASLKNHRTDKIDLKKQRGPRCTSMKKELRPPSKVHLPLINPAVSQRNYTDLARRSPEPLAGPLFDQNKQIVLEPQLHPSFPHSQI